MNPLKCVDSTELDLTSESIRDIETYVLPGGKQTIKALVRTFSLKHRWKAESLDAIWTVWVQYDDEDQAPRMLGITHDRHKIDYILCRHLPTHVYKAVYVIQQMRV